MFSTDAASLDTESLDAYLRERAAADEFSGVVRLDVDESGGESRTVFEQGYGYASRAWGVPCTPDIRFDTASTTKLFTAVAVLQQVDAEAITLDTSVTQYLGLQGTKISDAVTPYHLLTHTSGIGDDADQEAGERYEDLFIDRPNYAVRETKDFLPQFIDKDPNFAPGEGCRYCNVSYVLLGLMIEQATGQSYREYVTERVFAVAGMSDAVFAASDVVTPRVAEGADPIATAAGTVEWKRNIFSYPPIGSPDAGAHVTAADLMAFHRALRAGRLLSPALTAEMLRPHALHTKYRVGGRYTGFGFEFSVDDAGDVLCYWKEGINVGVSAVLQHYPRDHATLVILSTMEDGAWDPLRELNRRFGVLPPPADTIS